MKVAYIRVSTEEQNTDRQIEAMNKLGIAKQFTEKISAKQYPLHLQKNYITPTTEITSL